MQEAFAKLKSKFSSAPILVTPELSFHFSVEVEASEVGVGVGLSQLSHRDKKLYHCAYYSHRLSPAEWN